MCDQQSLRSACAYAQSDQSLCWWLKYSMIVKLLKSHALANFMEEYIKQLDFPATVSFYSFLNSGTMLLFLPFMETKVRHQYLPQLANRTLYGRTTTLLLNPRQGKISLKIPKLYQQILHLQSKQPNLQTNQ